VKKRRLDRTSPAARPTSAVARAGPFISRPPADRVLF
jgi:hypothetical protein